MVTNVTNFDAIVNYDLDVSARRTKVALAVVKGDLVIIDLKQTSIWQRVKLWWNNSLERKTIGNFLSLNVKNWSEAINDKDLRAKFELQCNKLHRKIKFTHNPQWALEIKFRYPEKAQSDAKTVETTRVFTFDRCTTNEEVISAIGNERFNLEMNGMNLSPRFVDIFEEHDDVDVPKSHMGKFLQDSEEGKDRTCTITFKKPNQQKLMEEITKEAVNHGRAAQQQEDAYNRALRRQARAEAANAAAFNNAVLTSAVTIGVLAAGAGNRRCHRRR